MRAEATKMIQPAIGDDEQFERMSLGERLQHAVLVISFLTLVLTGLPIFFHQLPVLNWAFSVEGSFRLRGLLHRGAAIGLVCVSVYHLFWIITTARGRETFLQLMPVRKDITDAFESLFYNLGIMVWLRNHGFFVAFLQSHPYWLFQHPPRFDRYNFIEKFEYLAVVWGNMVMITTGFLLWYPVISARIFPMWVYEIVRVVHGFEALLALLSIAIWHMYNVHVNPEVFPMSKVWLNGKITGRELRLLHPLEYERIVAARTAQG